MFQFFEHTADLGIRVESDRLDELFIEAARALTAALIDDPATIQSKTVETLEIPGDDIDYLFFDWLRELLLRFETRRMLFVDFQVVIDGNRLTATISGEPLDATRHPLGHEVKAITLHGLSVQKVHDQWVAEVIVDI